MYNKYIGNTGKFIRVEDHRGRREGASRTSAAPSQSGVTARSSRPSAGSSAARGKKHPPFRGAPQRIIRPARRLGRQGGGLLGGLGGGLKGLTGMFDHLPFGLDIGDILLFLMLFFFFLESGDEEFIIILAVIAFSLFKER